LAENPNAEETEPARPDVVIHDASVDLQEVLEQEYGLVLSDYSTPLIIPAADFNRDGGSSDYFFSFGGGYFSAGNGCFMAPVYLPHGATVGNFFVYAFDNSAGSNLTLNLVRKENATTVSPQTMATVTTSGSSTSVMILGDTTVDNPIVDQGYSYFVTGCWPGETGTTRVYGIWIWFTEP